MRLRHARYTFPTPPVNPLGTKGLEAILEDGMDLVLPWPPSANRYYRTVRGRPILSAVARQYRAAVVAMYNQPPLEGRIALVITANPPDLRKRDLDNLLKQTLDALQAAGIFKDDSQIDQILIRRGIKTTNGNLEVELWPLSQ